MPFTINEERDEYGERTITRSISERQEKKKDPEYNTDSYLRDQQALKEAREDAERAKDVELAEIPKGGFDYGSFETKKKKDSMSY